MTTMTHITRTVVLAVTLAGAAVGSASAEILGFDDLATPASWQYGTYIDTIPAGYGGLTWTGAGVVRQTSGMSGYLTGLVSGEQTMYTRVDFSMAMIQSATPWTFDGAFMTGAWRTDMTVTLTGLLGGATVHSMTFTLGVPTAPTWVQANFTGIDTLRIQATGGTTYWGPVVPDNQHLAIDGFSYTVPAPGAIALLGLAGLTRRRSR